MIPKAKTAKSEATIGHAILHIRGAAGGASTEHIRLDRRKCVACWECLAACKRGVIGKIDCPFHKHAHIDRADRCRGCGLCIGVCRTGAIQPASDVARARLARGA